MVDPKDLMDTLQKIKEIATSAAPKITDISAKDQIVRIGDLAGSALIRSQAQPGTDGTQGG